MYIDGRFQLSYFAGIDESENPEAKQLTDEHDKEENTEEDSKT